MSAQDPAKEAPRSRPTMLQLDAFAQDRGMASLWRLPSRAAGSFDRCAYDAALAHWQSARVSITITIGAGASS